MAISLVNNLSMNRSDAAVAADVWTATSATLSDFQAAASGAWVRLATDTITGGPASVIRDNVFSSTYQVYKLLYNDVTYSTGTYPFLQFLTGGDGTVAAASSYKHKAVFLYGGLTTSSVSDMTQSQTTGIQLNTTYDQDSTDISSNGEITFYNPADNTFYNTVMSAVSNFESGQFRYFRGITAYDGAKISATGYKFYPNAGTISTGEFVLYGLARA